MNYYPSTWIIYFAFYSFDGVDDANGLSNQTAKRMNWTTDRKHRLHLSISYALAHVEHRAWRQNHIKPIISCEKWKPWQVKQRQVDRARSHTLCTITDNANKDSKRNKNCMLCIGILCANKWKKRRKANTKYILIT